MHKIIIEPFTDKEKRIFLAAMGREEKICKEMDAMDYDTYLEDICKEIKRKVKNALWSDRRDAYNA